MTDPTNPPPTTLDDVVVVGVRAKKNLDVPEEMEEVEDSGGGGNGSGGGSGGYWFSQQEVDAENQRQKDCAAKKAGEAIKASPLSNAREWFSQIFNRNGSTAYHPPRGGTGPTIQPATFAAARTEFGFTANDVTGIVHNHPADEYCNDQDPGWNARQRAYNQYPSVGDWAYADDIIAAQYDNFNDLTIYIVGCDGVTRGFQYSDKASLLPFAEPQTQANSPTIPATIPGVNPADCPA